jgi:hypothetical protein
MRLKACFGVKYTWVMGPYPWLAASEAVIEGTFPHRQMSHVFLDLSESERSGRKRCLVVRKRKIQEIESEYCKQQLA